MDQAMRQEQPALRQWLRERSPGFATFRGLREDKTGQLDVLARSFPREEQREEFRFLFSTLSPEECRNILRLHSECPDPMARVEADRRKLDAIINARKQDHDLDPQEIKPKTMELLGSIRMHTKFADADHILVYCLARGAGYKDVRVTDAVQEKKKTLYLKEARVREIASEFRDGSDPAAVSEKLLCELSGQFSQKLKKPQPETPGEGYGLAL